MTQEELAEAIHVSRVWYAWLESGGAARPSPQLLDRLANALMLTPDERTTLFRLAIPELEHARLRPAPAALIDSLSLVRSTTKRLWAASSENEALTIMSEQIATWFGDAPFVGYLRLASGRWEWPYYVDRGPGDRVNALWEECVASWRPEKIDEMLLFPRLAQPGDVGTSSEDHLRAMRRKRRDTYGRHGLDVSDFIHAIVRSRNGLIGGLHVKHKAGRAYSELDRAFMGTLAAITSLALS